MRLEKVYIELNLVIVNVEECKSPEILSRKG